MVVGVLGFLKLGPKPKPLCSKSVSCVLPQPPSGLIQKSGSSRRALHLVPTPTVLSDTPTSQQVTQIPSTHRHLLEVAHPPATSAVVLQASLLLCFSPQPLLLRYLQASSLASLYPFSRVIASQCKLVNLLSFNWRIFPKLLGLRFKVISLARMIGPSTSPSALPSQDVPLLSWAFVSLPWPGCPCPSVGTVQMLSKPAYLLSSSPGGSRWRWWDSAGSFLSE